MQLSSLKSGTDVRGRALGENVQLTDEVVSCLCASFGQWLKKEQDLKVAVGRDSRLSGPRMAKAAVNGLRAVGAKVDDLMLSTTPSLFMATQLAGYDGAVMLTASHHPADKNGIKFITPEGALSSSQLDAVIAGAEKLMKEGRPFPDAEAASRNFMPEYAAFLVKTVRDAVGLDKPLAGMRIVVDAGHGAGGFFAADVLQPLGADTTGSQFLEPDGSFPAHAPNPENEAAMAAIVDCVKRNNADFGIIFDADVDRAGAVGAGGLELNRNRLIALVAAVALKDHPGAAIVTDSVTSAGLTRFIEELGGVHHRYKRGYRNVIEEAQRLIAGGQDAPVAMETSGHCAFSDNRFLDDGAYLIARLIILLAQLKKEGRSLGELIAALPEAVEEAEVRLTITEPDFRSAGEAAIEAVQQKAKKLGWMLVEPNYEGVRVAFGKNDWFLLRLSVHDPILPLNFESGEAGGVLRMARALLPILQEQKGVDATPLEKLTCPNC